MYTDSNSNSSDITTYKAYNTIINVAKCGTGKTYDMIQKANEDNILLSYTDTNKSEDNQVREAESQDKVAKSVKDILYRAETFNDAIASLNGTHIHTQNTASIGNLCKSYLVEFRVNYPRLKTRACNLSSR